MNYSSFVSETMVQLTVEQRIFVVTTYFSTGKWPPRSPDMTLGNFFLWGYVKSKVYVTPPTSIDDLKQKVTHEIRSVKRDLLLIRRAVKDMIRRAWICMAEGGGHIERL